jgi:hypothetical protein
MDTRSTLWIVQDNEGRNIIKNTKLDDMLHYNMTRKFLNLALRAASNPCSTLLVNNILDILSKQVEEEINGCTDNVEPITVPMNVAPPSDLVSTTCLKKKVVQTKTSKCKKNIS